MSPKPVSLLASAAGGVAVLGILPSWCMIALVATGTALGVLQVTVTQIIRLRAIYTITTSAHALRALEIEERAQITDAGISADER